MTFENPKPSQTGEPSRPEVRISQVTTEMDFISNSNQLENALVNNQFVDFCSYKIANSRSDVEETVWNFLKVSKGQRSYFRFHLCRS